MSYRDIIVADSPSLYWPLDTTYGATDQSGNGRSGTGSGGISIGAYSGSPIPGETTATDFDGSDDKITSSYNPFTTGTVRSFMGWAWRDDTAAEHDITGGANNAGQPTFSLLSGGETFNFMTDSAATSYQWANAWPGTGQWVFWVLIFDDPGDSAELFINAVSQGSKSVTNVFPASPGNLQVGAYGTGLNNYNGKMAHFAVWERKITQAQIQGYYNVVGGTHAADLSPRTHAAGHGQ